MLAGADVSIGISAPGIVTEDDLAAMNQNGVVFALANPTRTSTQAHQHVAVVAIGRSDVPTDQRRTGQSRQFPPPARQRFRRDSRSAAQDGCVAECLPHASG
jgi:malic enzyme